MIVIAIIWTILNLGIGLFNYKLENYQIAMFNMAAFGFCAAWLIVELH